MCMTTSKTGIQVRIFKKPSRLFSEMSFLLWFYCWMTKTFSPLYHLVSETENDIAHIFSFLPVFSLLARHCCSFDLIWYLKPKITYRYLPQFVSSTDRESSLSSFKCGFLNIFWRKNFLRSLSPLLFLLRWSKYGAKKCLKTRFRSTFEMIQL